VRPRRGDRLAMPFHLGKPILVMLALSVLGGVALAIWPRPHRNADLVLWVSAEPHLRTYAGGDAAATGSAPSLVEQFHRRTGKRVDVQMVSTRSEDVRLVSKFMSGSRDVPDAVEIEISSVAKYFRPPTDEIGLLPLNDLLVRSGWMDKIVKARFAPWTKNGLIFGVPHDVHPVAIAYRDDLFREAGVDLSAAKTWPQFQDACLRFQDYFRARRVPNRHAIELSNSTAEHLIPILLQRHLNPIDGDGNIELTKDKFVETVAFYAELVAGPRSIGAQVSAGAGGLARDLAEGHICAFFVPDWRVDLIKQYAPVLEGKMRLMPMPIFEPGDARTATWGGTMIGIPRNAKDPRASWELIEFLYFSDAGIAARRKYTSILPPVITAWNDPIYRRGDPFFGGQQIDLLFIELAKELPARYVTPATSTAGAALTKVLIDATEYVERGRGTREQLVAQCRRWLGAVAIDVWRRVEHGTFHE
jgi:arabinosaccharide transport system substrate-binding protein